MPLPNDSLNRWWMEIAPENPALAEQFSQCLLALLAFNHNLEPTLVGSAFILGSGDGFALAFTASHVLPAGVHRSQTPSARHAPSALFVPPSCTVPSLDQRKLRALWLTTRGSGMLNVAHLCYNDSLDISSFLVVLQERRGGVFLPAGIPLDTSIPAKGDVVHMVSNDRLDVQEAQPPVDRDGLGHELRIGRSLSIRIGVVTGVYPGGLRQYRWPCFTTSIPARPGMSGGFVFIPRDKQTVAACGVVSADHSDPAAHDSFTTCGESVIACTWPALALSVPTMMGGGITDPPTETLYNMMKLGLLMTASGGIDHIQIRPIEGGVRVHCESVAPRA